MTDDCHRLQRQALGNTPLAANVMKRPTYTSAVPEPRPAIAPPAQVPRAQAQLEQTQLARAQAPLAQIQLGLAQLEQTQSEQAELV
jgi:hypothetical protein